MAERYSDFIWDYYGGRPFRRTFPSAIPNRAPWMRISELPGNSRVSGENMGYERGMAARRGTLWTTEDDNRITGRDMEYFQAMYPEKMKKLQMKINDLCDAIDYEGSVLYDEYPDRVGLSRLCDEICSREIEEDTDGQVAEWIRAAVEVLLYHEICRRRLQRRGLRRRY